MDAVSSDLQLTQYCFIVDAPEEFMQKVFCMAAIKSRRDILECANVFGINCNESFETIPSRIMLDLSKEGNLYMMKYLLEKFCIFRESQSCIGAIFRTALKKGNLEVLEWINKIFPDYMNMTQTNHEYRFGTVLAEGNRDAIKWFIEMLISTTKTGEQMNL